MPWMSIFLDGDNCWPDLADKIASHKLIDLGNDPKPIGVALLDKGMASGKPSVTIRVDLPDGRVVLTQTSARLFCTAAKAIMGRHPDLFEGECSFVDMLLDDLEERNNTLMRREKALRDIEAWARAYPVKIFPKPNLTLAATALKQHGLTLDAISADAMRHVLDGVLNIVKDGLGDD